MNLIDPFSLTDFQTKFLKNGDLGPLQDLLERSADYIELVTGLPLDPYDAQSLLEDVPEGKSVEDKALIGIYTSQGSLIGVLDAVRDHPKRGDWWLGLLLIDPLCRRKGLGEDIYSAFEKWIVGSGGKDIYLGVVETNKRALKFWQKIGFEIIDKRPPRKFGNLDQVIIVMRRRIMRE